MNTFWLNGEFLEQDELSISPSHLGLTTGEGIFETLLGRSGEPFAVRRHIERLEKGAAVFDLKTPSHAVVTEVFRKLMKRNDVPEAKLRLTLTTSTGHSEEPTVLMTADSLPAFPESYSLVTVPFTRNENGALVGLKSTSYAENNLAVKMAKQNGADDAIFANTAGHLCEGSAFNLFVKYAGQWITPTLSAGPLAGVTRELTLELATKVGIDIEERDTPVSDLKTAEAAFLTSSLRIIKPIHSIDGRNLPSLENETLSPLKNAFEELMKDRADP